MLGKLGITAVVGTRLPPHFFLALANLAGGSGMAKVTQIDAATWGLRTVLARAKLPNDILAILKKVQLITAWTAELPGNQERLGVRPDPTITGPNVARAIVHHHFKCEWRLKHAATIAHDIAKDLASLMRIDASVLLAAHNQASASVAAVFPTLPQTSDRVTGEQAAALLLAKMFAVDPPDWDYARPLLDSMAQSKRDGPLTHSLINTPKTLAELCTTGKPAGRLKVNIPVTNDELNQLKLLACQLDISDSHCVALLLEELLTTWPRVREPVPALYLLALEKAMRALIDLRKVSLSCRDKAQTALLRERKGSPHHGLLQRVELAANDVRRNALTGIELVSTAGVHFSPAYISSLEGLISLSQQAASQTDHLTGHGRALFGYLRLINVLKG